MMKPGLNRFKQRTKPGVIENPSQEQSQGTILFVAVAMLMGFLLFAVVFARVTSVERTAANNYMHKLDARSIARAGLHRAVAELRSHYETHSYDDSRKTNSGGEYRPNDPWCYYDRYYRDAFYVSNANSSDTTKQSGPQGLKLTPNISFRNEATINNVKTVLRLADMTSDQDFYISGNMGNSAAGGLKDYRLKILDCASMLHVNNKDVIVMQRMLKNLLRARTGLNDTDANTIATRVRQRRPGGGYLTKEEVGLIMRDTGSSKRLSEAQWELIKDDITCFAWADNKVIVPPLTQYTSSTSGSVTAVGTSQVNDNSLNANLELTERAPININTASLPVLISVFADLEGVVTESKRNYSHNGTPSVTTSVVKTIDINLRHLRPIVEFE